jgi:hypothetical protein
MAVSEIPLFYEYNIFSSTPITNDVAAAQAGALFG